MSRSSRNAGKPLWLVVVLAIAAWLYRTYIEPPKNSPRAPEYSRQRKTPTPRSNTPRVEGGQVLSDTVIKVSDGDTVRLQNIGSARLIGVDTPETHFAGKAQPGGEEAGEFTRRALLNQRVEVELCARQPYDRYGRALAFIYLRQGSKRVLFNRELVRQGYARVYSLRPCTIDEADWNKAYEEARRARRGLFATLGEVPDAASFRRENR